MTGLGSLLAPPPGTRLQLAADLRFRVAAPRGRSTSGTVTADGSTVSVNAEDPVVLVRALGSTDRRRTATLGTLLADTGVTVELTGPRGSFARYGAGVQSRVGRVVTGSPHVDVRGAVVTTWRAQGARVGLAAGVLGALVVAAARRRSRRG